ncbi:hypothetical protein [Tenacibaculum agarivorans]|uniref:hypothetical protein n=1 Tax=Tenacibaculum agarivorans TaxID=1908389 RepID=UPI00094BC225|nr:hypothetical protein [Tenacibaculum agarivorans]
MKIGFDNIYDQIVPMEKFRLKWRFTEKKYDILPQIHLEQLKPLNKKASKFIWDFISNSRMHNETPFKKDFFNTIDKVKILDSNKKEIKKWLYQRGLPFEKEVFLSWQSEDAMIVPWKLLIKYFDSFYYGSSDDLTIIDQSLNWAVLFYHEDEIYFGTNKGLVPNETFENLNFIR